MSERAKNSPVSITGIGIVSAIGNDVNSFWSACLRGDTVVEEIPQNWTNYYESKSRHWSPLKLPEFARYGLKRSAVLSQDHAVLNAIVAAEDALADAGFTKTLKDERNQRFVIDAIDQFRSGVIVGTGLGCISSAFQNYVPHLLSRLELRPHDINAPEGSNNIAAELERNLAANPRVSPLASIKSMANAISSSISIRFGFKGENETSTVACAAGSVAIAKAVRAIREGNLDIAIAGGSEYYGDYAGGVFMAFDRLNTLAKSTDDPKLTNRPFDRDRSGFLFSQGAACMLVLESEHHARTRGVRPIANIIGTAITSDAYSLVAISPEDNAIEPMIRKAISDAGLTPSDVQYVNAHGTGTEQNDPIEANMLGSIFGSDVMINSTKSLLGHTIGACGAIETAVAALSIARSEVHPSINICNPIMELNFVQKATKAKIEVAMTQNFGFGGHNCGLVLTT